MVKEWYILLIDGSVVNNAQNITFEDSAGTKSDRVVISLPPNTVRPKPYAEIQLSLFNSLGDVLKCGTFYVQSVTRVNNKSLTITATGVKFNQDQKKKKSYHYQNTKLSSIVNLVAKRLKCKVKFTAQDTKIESLYQTNESDINFLYRLAEEYNALFSIKNNYVYFVSRLDNSLPVTIIDATKASNINITHSARTFYKSAEATYYNAKKAKNEKVKVGSGEPTLQIKGAFKNKQDAQIKAKRKLEAVQTGTVNGYLTHKGLKVYAGTMLQLINTYNNEDDKKFYIKHCTHTFSRSSGWVVDIEFENFKLKEKGKK